MTPSRQERVKELSDSVRDCSPAERSTILGPVKAQDPQLCDEVEALLEGTKTMAAGQRAFENLDAVHGPPPSLLEQRYRLEREMGRGAFGVVYLARDERLHNKPVVVKFLIGETRRDEWFGKKFRDEIVALSRLNYPGIVGIVDTGQTQAGTPFLVMQYVEGVTLRSLIKSGGMELIRTGQIVQQIGQALAAAHAAGVFHRDLKPENIMVQQSPRGEFVWLIDFGIATIREQGFEGADELTRVAGSPGYMAPEQFRGQPEPASDIFAMGVISWELLAGKRPFGNRSPIQAMADPDFLAELDEIRQLRSDVPEAAIEVIWKALAIEPADRFQSASAFGNELARALSPPEGRLAQTPSVQQRVLDVAMARQIPIHKPAEVVALVRRTESGGLAALLQVEEDRSVSKEDIRSRPFQLEFPLGSARSLKPLELGLRLDCPDFEPRAAFKTLLVPPAGDSDACTFLITPIHLGELRVNVELTRGDVLVASRALKTEATPSDRKIIDPSKILVSIPLSVMVSASEAAKKRELLIQLPDGQMKTVPLRAERLSLGRSRTSELCFPDDAGLSRQHLMFEREGDYWTVRDLESTNGTVVNNNALKSRMRLQPGDRIVAGHLVIMYDDGTHSPAPGGGVVFADKPETDSPSTSTVITSLEGALSNQVSREAATKGTAQVEALIRAGRELAGSRPLPELFQLILDLSIDGIGAQRGVVMILEGDRLVVKAHKGEGFRISSSVRDRVLNEKNSLLVRDAQLDEAFRGKTSIVEHMVRTLMAVPLQTKDRIIGLIYVDSPYMVREFTKDDLSLLTVMANTAAIRIEHARLAQVEELERRMARELKQAAEIQRGFLPGKAPIVPGADLAGYNAPCRTVGGDYYDFFTYPNGRVALVLGDVSGKGMPASLIMMQLQARMRVLADEPKDLAVVLSRLNKITSAKWPSNRFVGFFFCILDPASGELVYCNAGLNPPILVRSDGTLEFLREGGPVLGILPTVSYREFHREMGRGDVLVLYSDGVTEAPNPEEEEFGEDRLVKVLVESRTLPAAGIVQAVNLELAKFTAGAPPADDLTLAVVRRT